MWLYVPNLPSSPSAPESAASTSPSTSPSEPELCVSLSGKVTQRLLSWRGWKARPCIAHLSGVTLQPLTAVRGVGEWILSLPVSPANPSQSPASGKEQQTNTSRDWKDGTNPSEKVPTNALLGRASARWPCPSSPPAPPTPPPGDESSQKDQTSPRLWPTAKAMNINETPENQEKRRKRLMEKNPHLGDYLQKQLGVEAQRVSGVNKKLNPNFVAWLMGLPHGLTSFALSETAWYLWRQRMRSALYWLL